MKTDHLHWKIIHNTTQSLMCITLSHTDYKQVNIHSPAPSCPAQISIGWSVFKAEGGKRDHHWSGASRCPWCLEGLWTQGTRQAIHQGPENRRRYVSRFRVTLTMISGIQKGHTFLTIECQLYHEKAKFDTQGLRKYNQLLKQREEGTHPPGVPIGARTIPKHQQCIMSN